MRTFSAKFVHRDRREDGQGNATETEGGIHLVSVQTDVLGFVLGQVKTSEKSNEVTALPQFLTTLDLSSCIITIDACSLEMSHHSPCPP